jgi:beta-galactosidase
MILSLFSSSRGRPGGWAICMAFGLLALFAGACQAQPQAQPQAHPGREVLSLDRGWLFHLGDIPFPKIVEQEQTYRNAKAGNAGGAAATRYNDAAWRKLDLPHDWAVEGPFDPRENISQGYRPRGIGWYRRYLRVDEVDRGRHVELQFDGIATNATIWVNGTVVHHNWSGYTASRIDLTPFLRYGNALNTIAVRVDAETMEGWWYEGAGIYRHAWLVKTDPVHVPTDGVHATPRQDKRGNWSLPVEVRVANSGREAAQVSVEVTLTDPAGRTVARRSGSASVAVLGESGVKLPLALAAPKLWSPAHTILYKLTTTVRQAGRIVDQVALHTGFRSIRFDPAQGFFLNGEHMKLKGVCIHQDHAGVGVALPDAIWEYRLRRLKELGANAIRFSHNAPAPEVLDMADRMGFLVMDENRNFNPSPEYMGQLEWMVRRDRHHPSVILWSVFNEEPTQGSEVGYEMVRRMAAAVKALDDTRPVTAAMSNGLFTPLNVSHAVDVLGANYQVKDYDRYHQAHPQQPFTSSEDTSAFMTRGEYLTDAARHTAASYDDDHARWGNSHRDGWQAIASRPWVAGGFVWTGFDYRGEPTPYSWPSVSSFFGIMDLNGFPKTAYYMHQVQWIADRPLIHIAPHWNWPGREGQPVRVLVMANAERVRLLLNGRELGEQQVDRYRMNEFQVPYQPGTLEAVGYTGGREVARARVETTGPAVRLELVPDRTTLAGDGRDALPITVRALDAEGRAVPLAAPEVSFSVTGAGRAIGHGNGDPNSHEDEKGPTRRLFNGLAQLIVQSEWDSHGASRCVPAPPAWRRRCSPFRCERLPTCPPCRQARRRRSTWTNGASRRPASSCLTSAAAPAANDMNSWGLGKPPLRHVADEGRYRLYRASFDLPQRPAGARLRFTSLEGRAQVWLNGRLLRSKESAGMGELVLTLPPGEGPAQLVVICEARPGQPAGLGGEVLVEPAP